MIRGTSPVWTLFSFRRRSAVVIVMGCISLIVGSSVQAGTLHLDAGKGDDIGNGSAANPKATIGAAIAVAAAGDRILVAAGTYAEDVTITEELTLAAAKPDQPKLSGRLTLQCNDAVVEGLSWSGQNGGATVNIYGKRNIVQRCRFREFGRQRACKGIWIRQSGDHGDNRIEHCLFEDWTGHGSSSCIKVSQNGNERRHVSGRPHPLPKQHVYRWRQDRDGRSRALHGNGPSGANHLGEGSLTDSASVSIVRHHGLQLFVANKHSIGMTR